MKSIAWCVRRKSKGQTTIETAFVFAMLLFITFALMNLGILLHTKMIATYSAFMAGRSFQVLGDETSANLFVEATDLSGDQGQPFLAEMNGAKYPAFFRVAEDIFTCALPWMSAPQDDALEDLPNKDPDKITIDDRCMSGRRKYETLNIGNITFTPWEPGGTASAALGGNQSGLETVTDAFSEPGRDPLKYGVLRLPYRTPILFDFTGAFGGQFHSNEVFVPLLLNPGLDIKLEEGDGNEEKDFESSAFKSKN